VNRVPAPYPDGSDAQAACDAAARSGEGWLAIDGYQFDIAYHAAVRRSGWPTLVVDDYAHLSRYDADVLVNQNVDAEQLTYHGQPWMKKLLGPEYVLLRDEIVAAHVDHTDVAPIADRLLLTMGGGDPDNVTGVILQALAAASVRPLQIRIVIGPSNPHRAVLEQIAAQCPGAELIANPRGMAPLFRAADLVITASGSTCWEAGYLGVPMLTVVTAENQRRIAAGLARRGASYNLGWHAALTPAAIVEAVSALRVDPRARASLRDAARQLVDGRGAARVAAALLHRVH
jgi:UDP-2,4-diacetamido-2,4,6-trideoxy-beta-L-altropyranose hydrolase